MAWIAKYPQNTYRESIEKTHVKHLFIILGVDDQSMPVWSALVEIIVLIDMEFVVLDNRHYPTVLAEDLCVNSDSALRVPMDTQ